MTAERRADELRKEREREVAEAKRKKEEEEEYQRKVAAAVDEMDSDEEDMDEEEKAEKERLERKARMERIKAAAEAKKAAMAEPQENGRSSPSAAADGTTSMPTDREDTPGDILANLTPRAKSEEDRPGDDESDEEHMQAGDVDELDQRKR